MSLSLRWRVLLVRTGKSIQTKFRKSFKLYNYFSEYGPWKRGIDEAVSDSSAKAVARRLDKTLKLRRDMWVGIVALVVICLCLRLNPSMASNVSVFHWLGQALWKCQSNMSTDFMDNWASQEPRTFFIMLVVAGTFLMVAFIGYITLVAILLLWVHLSWRIRTLDARIKVLAHLATRGATPEEDDDIDTAFENYRDARQKRNTMTPVE